MAKKSLPLPTLHPRYAIEELIAEGGMGSVYKVWDRLAEKWIVIKKKSPGIEPAVFLREFQILLHLHHPNLPSVYDYGISADGEHFLTMEWITGKNLAQSEPLNAPVFYSTFLQLLSVLNYLHQRRIIHHDLKPENILLTDGEIPKIKLIDFGLALTAEDEKAVGSQGTLQYTAPEILKKESYDHRSDLYWLGVILYEWLTGKNPFDDPNVVNVVVNHLEKKIENLDTNFTFAEEWLKKIILKLLIKDPRYRYQNVREIYDDLRPHIPALQSALSYDVDFDEIFLNSCFLYRENFIDTLERLNDPSQLKEPFKPVFLLGEEGAGKTTLLFRWIERLQTAGHRTVYFSVTRSLHHPEDLRLFLKHIFYSTPAPEGFVEEIDWITGKTDSYPAHDETTLFSIMSDFVIAARTPLTMIVDDTHLADPFLQNFFKYLLRKLNLQKERSVICLFAGSDDAIALLAPGESFDSIRLEIFTEEQSNELTKRLLNSAELNGDFLRWLYTTTRGNPFLIENTITDAIHNQALLYQNKDWRWFPDRVTATPSSVNEFILSKIQNLAPEDKKLVEIFSLFPASFSYDTLHAAGISVNLQQKFEKLIRQNILARQNGDFILNNRYLRNRIYERIDLEEKKRLHFLLAAFYESEYPEAVGDMAYHYFRSTEKAKALPYLVRLSDQQKSNFLFAESIQSHFEACEILRETCQFETLLEQLFKAEELLDQLGERQKQKETLDEILAIGHQLPDKKFKVKGLLRQANYLERISEYETSQKITEQAIELSKNESSGYLLGQLYRQLGKSYYHRALWNKALECYQETYRIALESKDLHLEMEAHNSMGTVYGSQYDFENGAKEFKSTLDIAIKLGDNTQLIASYFNLGVIFKKANQLDEASFNFQKALPFIKVLKSKLLEQKYLSYLGITFLEMNKYEEAYNLFDLALKLTLELDDIEAKHKITANLSLTLFRVGRYEQAIEVMSNLLNNAKQTINLLDFSINSIFLAELMFSSKKYSNVIQRFEDGNNYFKTSPHPFWSFYAKLLYIRFAVDTNFILVSEKSLKDEIGSVNDLFNKLQSSEFLSSEFSSLRIMGFFLLSKLCQKINTSHAFKMSCEAVKLLEAIRYYEFSSPEIFFHHYLVLKDSDFKFEQSQYLQKAYQKIKEVENSLKRSDFKSSYLNIPLHQEIIIEYKKFFDKERESDIQSFQKLYEITRDINSTLDSIVLFEKIMDNAIKHSQADRGLIILNTGTADEFEIKVARNMDQETLSDITNISQSIVKEVFENGQSIVTADANLDDRFKERKSIVNYHIRSIMCVPLRIKDKISGAVYLDKQFDTHYFGPHQLKFLESFANLAGLAIENAKMYEALYHEKEYLEKENVDLKLAIQGKYVTHNIVGRSRPMRQVYHLIESAANNTATVLIEGESGTGKELVARAIHYNGNRKNQKFIAVDCGAMPENLLESELFGYKKGAFTGAANDKKGLFEEADGGTIFLDEITNTSLGFQAKLLRVIQEGEIRPVGENLPRKINVRIIAATNKDLVKQVEQNLFREDLFYRLNVIPIRLPALRERKDDLPLLIQFFIEKYSKTEGKRVETVSKDLIDAMMEYSWPGNIRELENMVQRMIIFSNSKKLSLDNLPEEIKTPFERKQVLQSKMILHIGGKESKEQIKVKNLNEFENELMSIERSYFEQILKNADGNKSKAAEILGIKRTTLNDRLKKLGL